MIRDTRRMAGFLLIETVMAIAIAGFALSVILSGLAVGLRNTEEAHKHIAAIRIAQSRMAALGRMEPLAAGARELVIDDMVVRETVLAAGPAVRLQSSGGVGVSRPMRAVQLYKLEVEVRWPQGDGVRSTGLATLRVGNADGP